MAKRTDIIGDVTNDAKGAVEAGMPYIVSATIVGTSAMLFHRWSCDAVEAKAKAGKNSKAKKMDDVNSYVYRNEEGDLCLPGEYLRQAVIHAARFRQDPRSPRKSAMDLYKAGVVSLTDLASLGAKDWDFLDRRRVCVQRNGITRERPAMRAGWRANIEFQVLTPEYIEPDSLADVLANAGRLIGVGDFRPTFGRFRVESFRIAVDEMGAVAE